MSRVNEGRPRGCAGDQGFRAGEEGAAEGKGQGEEDVGKGILIVAFIRNNYRLSFHTRILTYTYIYTQNIALKYNFASI